MTRTNAHGQPIGEPVPDWAPRLPPAHTTLTGQYVALEPVAAAHAPGLYAALATEDDDASWTYRIDERPDDEAGMLRLVEAWASRPVDVTFAIVPADTGTPAGIATLMRVDPANGVAEVGSIIYARSLRRTRGATEAIHLLARYLFDDLGYRRFEWKLDCLNEPSASGCAPAGVHLRGPVPQRDGLQGPQPRHRLVRDDRRRLAADPRRAPALAGPGQLRRRRRQRTSLSDLGTVAARGFRTAQRASTPPRCHGG